MLKKRKLRYESLEDRKMMAGNVTAAVAGGVLTITGDTNDNDISLVPTGIANTFVVQGNNGTTINGAPGGFLAVGVTGDVDVNMDDGNDVVTINNTAFAANLNITHGDNDFTLNLGVGGSIYAAGAITVINDAGNAGNNVVNINANVVQSAGAQAYILADDDNTLNITGGSTVRSLTIASGANADFVSVSQFFAGTNVAIDTDDGGDTISLFQLGTGGNLNVHTLGGQDVSLNTCHIRGITFLDIENGGDSIVTVQASVFDGLTSIATDTGNDTVTFANNIAKTVSISTFGGADTIVISASDIDRLFAYAGAGDDAVVIESTILHRFSQISAGTGNDTINNSGTGFSPFLSLVGYNNGPVQNPQRVVRI